MECGGPAPLWYQFFAQTRVFPKRRRAAALHIPMHKLFMRYDEEGLEQELTEVFAAESDAAPG